MQLEQSQLFEQILDRRLRDFEKIVETQLTGIQDGVTRMQETITVFVNKVSNLHIDYVPRTELEKEQARVDTELTRLKERVESLQAWRNTLAGAVGIMIVVIGWLVESHFWK